MRDPRIIFPVYNSGNYFMNKMLQVYLLSASLRRIFGVSLNLSLSGYIRFTFYISIFSIVVAHLLDDFFMHILIPSLSKCTGKFRN